MTAKKWAAPMVYLLQCESGTPLRHLPESMPEGELNNHLQESKASGEINSKNGKTKKTVWSLQVGIYLSENEGAKFRLSVLTNLVEDILSECML